MKIKELLELKPERVHYMYEDYPLGVEYLFELSRIIGVNLCNEVFVKSFVKNVCTKVYGNVNWSNSDGKRREIKVIFYEDKPVILYQLLGKEYLATNIMVLDSNFLKEIKDSCYTKEKTNIFNANLEMEIDIDGMGLQPEIKNERLVYVKNDNS